MHDDVAARGEGGVDGVDSVANGAAETGVLLAVAVDALDLSPDRVSEDVLTRAAERGGGPSRAAGAAAKGTAARRCIGRATARARVVR